MEKIVKLLELQKEEMEEYLKKLQNVFAYANGAFNNDLKCVYELGKLLKKGIEFSETNSIEQSNNDLYNSFQSVPNKILDDMQANIDDYKNKNDIFKKNHKLIYDLTKASISEINEHLKKYEETVKQNGSKQVVEETIEIGERYLDFSQNVNNKINDESKTNNLDELTKI